MIRAEITAIGTVKRAATIRTDKHNNPYLSFILAVNLADSDGKTKEIEIFVMDTKGQQSDLSLYSEKKRVSITGTLDIRTKGEDLVYYLNVKSITTQDVADLDAITGTLHFIGHLRKENFFEEKTDRNGNPYLIFSAYSTEKVGDNFVNTWVNFKRFRDSDDEVLREDWFQSKANVDITGDLQISAFKGRINLASRVKSIKPAERSQKA